MSDFQGTLNKYIEYLQCNTSDIALYSGLSSAAVSRYRSGTRIPKKDSESVQKLAQGIYETASVKGLSIDSPAHINAVLNRAIDAQCNNFSCISEHLDSLISVININVSDLAKYLNFDASYLSRIRNGQRSPADKSEFTANVCGYVVKKFNDNKNLEAIACLIGCDEDKLHDKDVYLSELINWFKGENTDTSSVLDIYLKKLDEFNLDEYIKAIHFNDIKIPSVPFHLPSSKMYYGVEQMKQAELDFFKNTVTSRYKESVFMCSDMQMDDMAQDMDFAKKWMFAIAASLKKGLHINMVHNINRPFNEMLLGLESWIPIYMTGQVSPYYLKNYKSNIFHHLNYVSASTALCGECIDGFHDEGKYYLTTNKDEVAFYRKKSERILAKASPLMEIYRISDKQRFEASFSSLNKDTGTRRNILSSLPIYTIDSRLLISMLKRAEISDNDTEKILAFVEKQKADTELFLENNRIFDEIPELSYEEFAKAPISLILSHIFFDKEITYTYDEFLLHLRQTKAFSDKHKNYFLHETPIHNFRNIQIQISENNWVMISKSKSPVIHFIIKQPQMVYALQNYIAPVVDI